MFPFLVPNEKSRLAYGMQSTLDYSLPNQLFPTAVRTTAVGSVLAMSCVGINVMFCRTQG